MTQRSTERHRSDIDLHMHSTASDGSLTPTALVERAATLGVQTLALTDHDTVAGLAEAKVAAQALGIGFIAGVEFSCVWNGMTLHVVGLNVDLEHPVLEKAVDTQQSNRLMRARAIADKLERLKLGEVWNSVSSDLGDKVPARPDFARYLVERGYVDSPQQAFERYLGAGKVGDVKQYWPELPEILDWIKQGDGVAVLAHPARYKMTTAKLRRLLVEFKADGGMALEVALPNIDSGRLGLMSELCQRHDLHASCGSDFHGPGSWQEIGRFPPLPSSVRPVWELWPSFSL